VQSSRSRWCTAPSACSSTWAGTCTAHRTALSGKALLAADDQHVTSRYRDSRDGQHKTMTLPVDEFLRRFLQHVLQHVPPKGFHRVRAFGLLHPEHRDRFRQLQLLLAPRKSSVQAQSTRA
jgi:hypothetical protein